jgi:ribosomal protein L7/L12
MNNQPTSLNCPACSAPLDFDGTSAVVRCKFCGNVCLVPGILPTQAAAPASVLDEIRKLAGGGNLVDAIERYRQTYGVDLSEAKNAIDALQAGRLATPSAPGMRPPEELTKALQEVQRLLSAGNKIEAIKVYRENYDVSFTRAKYAIEQIEGGQTLHPQMGFEALGTPLQGEVAPTQEARPAKSRKWLGCSVTVAIILLVGGLIGYLLFLPGGPFTPHYYPNGSVALIPSISGSAPNFAVGLYDSNKDTRFIGLVDGTTGKLSWHAAPLAGDGYVDALAAGPDLVYAASATDLLAYHKSDGSLAWQAQMSDKLNYGTSTMLVTAGRVITDNADQTIQAYDAATGSPVWNKRLTGYDRALRLMGDSLVMIDYIDNNYNYGLMFFDPTTGSQQKVVTPSCTYNDYDSNIGPDSGLVYDQAENALFLVYDSSYGCVQRLDLSSGRVAWSSNSQDGFSFSSDNFQSVLTDSSLYFSNGNDILAVNKSTGEMKVLLTNPDYNLLPLAMAGDKLIVRARRTRGTEKFELWGVEAASGRQAWQMDMQGASPIDPPNEMSGLIDDTDWGWTWKLVPGGLVVIRFEGKPNQLVLETFNPADGTSLGKQTLALKKVSGDFYSIPTVFGWQGNVVYLSLESNIYALDVATAKLKVVY